MNPTTVIEAVTQAEREQCFIIRADVFCGEQGVSREIEFDGLDAACRHYLATKDGLPAGTARVRPLEDGIVKFERIAVIRSHRRKHIGRALMDRAMSDSAAAGAVSGKLNAQTQATVFYEKLGFIRQGDLFMEAGIEHICMTYDFRSPFSPILSPGN